MWGFKSAFSIPLTSPVSVLICTHSILVLSLPVVCRNPPAHRRQRFWKISASTTLHSTSKSNHTRICTTKSDSAKVSVADTLRDLNLEELPEFYCQVKHTRSHAKTKNYKTKNTHTTHLTADILRRIQPCPFVQPWDCYVITTNSTIYVYVSLLFKFVTFLQFARQRECWVPRIYSFSVYWFV